MILIIQHRSTKLTIVCQIVTNLHCINMHFSVLFNHLSNHYNIVDSIVGYSPKQQRKKK